MPDTASLTLSSITWLKRKPTPGSWLIVRCMASTRPTRSGAVVHSSRGARLTRTSAWSKPLTSVPSSGRPSCETTFRTSGNDAKRARTCRMIAAASDGAIDSGSRTCTQSDALVELAAGTPSR